MDVTRHQIEDLELAGGAAPAVEVEAVVAEHEHILESLDLPVIKIGLHEAGQNDIRAAHERSGRARIEVEPVPVETVGEAQEVLELGGIPSLVRADPLTKDAQARLIARRLQGAAVVPHLIRHLLEQVAVGRHAG